MATLSYPEFEAIYRQTALECDTQPYSNVANALYARLERYNRKSVIKAMRDVGANEYKINLANIRKYLNDHEATRIDEENTRMKREEDEAMREDSTMPQEAKDFINKLTDDIGRDME